MNLEECYSLTNNSLKCIAQFAQKLKYLNISWCRAINDEGIAFGEVAFYVSSITRTAACQLVTQRGVLKIISDKESWTFTIYKADGKEFIFGEKGKLVYFSKMQ